MARSRSQRFLLFSLFLGLSPTLFWLEMKQWVFSNFLNFSAIFFNFLLRVGQEHIGTIFFFLFSLFHGLSQPIFVWKEAMMVFSNFLNFFAIFLEFSFSGRVETHRNEFRYFLSFSAFPVLFWLEKKLWGCFLIFWIFLLFFKKFLLRVG